MGSLPRDGVTLAAGGTSGGSAPRNGVGLDGLLAAATRDRGAPALVTGQP